MKPSDQYVAIVVLYHPSREKLLRKMTILREAVDYIVLVDNTESGTPWLEGVCDSVNGQILETKLDCCMYLSLFKNIGIAAAQNQAIQFLMKIYDPQTKVIFFDQDSQIETSLPKRLGKEFDRLSQYNDVAAVGPSFIDEHKGFVYTQVAWSAKGIFQRFTPDTSCTEQGVCALISSGMLTNLARLKAIGEYDESLFIDYVDTDWSLRAQAKGFVLFVIPSVTMQHAIGEKSVRVLGRDLSVHSPARRYYMLRNSIYMLKKNYVSKRLGCSFFFRTLVHHLIIITLEPNKNKQIAALFKGIFDGVFCKDRV